MYIHCRFCWSFSIYFLKAAWTARFTAWTALSVAWMSSVALLGKMRSGQRSLVVEFEKEWQYQGNWPNQTKEKLEELFLYENFKISGRKLRNDNLSLDSDLKPQLPACMFLSTWKHSSVDSGLIFVPFSCLSWLSSSVVKDMKLNPSDCW